MERSGDTGGHRAIAAGTVRAPGCDATIALALTPTPLVAGQATHASEPRDRYHHARDAVGAGASLDYAPGGATRVPRTRSDDDE